MCPNKTLFTEAEGGLHVQQGQGLPAAALETGRIYNNLWYV